LITGLIPRGFTWVIAERLAVSERVGGSGFQHRRVRREEEISWLVRGAGITDVISLLPATQNVAAYRDAGLAVHKLSLGPEVTVDEAEQVYSLIHKVMAKPSTKVLLHRETIDDSVGGILAGYLVWSGMVEQPVLAVAVVQEILKRPLGPEGRNLVPGAGLP
jgi:hypothetical protein